MLFKKNKTKSKVRFEQKEFTSKVRQARNFKRKSNPVSNTPYATFMKRLGLSTWWSQALAFLGLLGLIYILYVPNLLSIKSVEVIGANLSEKTLLETEAKKVIDTNPFWYPKNNLLFLQPKKIIQQISTNPNVYQVNSIIREWKTGKITVSVTLKYEKYLVLANSKVYDVYNDGTLKGLSGLSEEVQWKNEQNSSMTKLKFDYPFTLEENQAFLSQELLVNLNSFYDFIEDKIDQVQYIELKIPTSIKVDQLASENSVNSSDIVNEVEIIEGEGESEDKNDNNTALPQIELPLQGGELLVYLPRSKNDGSQYYVRINSTQEPDSVVARLLLLLSQMNPDRFNQLDYIDMRVDSKAFICLVNTPCSK